jgi:hypothetical protein
MSHCRASTEKPAWSSMRLVQSSQRNTPAKLSPNGTTALLKMLLHRGMRSRGMIGLPEYLHSGPGAPAGRSSHGIVASVL